MKRFRCISPVLIMTIFALLHFSLAAEEGTVSQKEFCQGNIVEIEEQGNGLAAIYFSIEQDDQASSIVNFKGQIYEDNSWSQLIGEFEVTEEFPGYCYAKLLKEVSPVEVGQVVRISNLDTTPLEHQPSHEGLEL